MLKTLTFTRPRTHQRAQAAVCTKRTAKLTANCNYTHDLNGAMLTDGLRRYEYDAANRLANVTTGASPYADGDAINGFDPYGLAACQVTFPNMPIDTGIGFSSTSLGGHGSILIFDSKGSTQYHEYGRYPSSQALGIGLPADEGNVRRVGVSNLKLDKNGLPTPESMTALRKALQDKAGKGTNADLTCDANADEKKIRDYIKQISEDANRAKYSWKPWSSNQCRDFAGRAFNAMK